MSDIQKQSQIDAAAGRPSRRKLIRLGAAVVPVVATLTSQSALAGNCISTSAWGSDQLSGSASQRARHNANGFTVNTRFNISAWNAAAAPVNSPTPPWMAFREAYPAFTNVGGNFMQNLVTFNQLKALDPAKFATPTAFPGTAKVVGSLGNNDQSHFVVAQLNFAANIKPPEGCVTYAVWLSIVAGTYPTPGNPWTLNQIALYLKNNSIVSF